MAKVILQNNREHDITISAQVGPTKGQKETVSATIPSGRQDPDDRNKFIPGIAEVDDSLIEAAKSSQVVQHYFDHGWLEKASAAVVEANEELNKE